MKLVIDNREKKLIDICNNLVKSEKTFEGIEIVLKNLELGDIIIEDDEGVELLLVERKTFDDLVASIKDGRYSEQGFRGSLLHKSHELPPLGACQAIHLNSIVSSFVSVFT